MEHCFWDVFWFNHYIRFTKSYKFVIIGKRENQWYDKVNINCVWWQKVETCYKKAFAILRVVRCAFKQPPYIVFTKGKGVVKGRCFGISKCSLFILISLYFVHIRICPSKQHYLDLPQGG